MKLTIASSLPAFSGSQLTIPYEGALASGIDIYLIIANAWGADTQVGNPIKFTKQTNNQLIFNNIGNLTPGLYYKVSLALLNGSDYMVISNYATVKYCSSITPSLKVEINPVTYKIEATIDYQPVNQEYLQALSFSLKKLNGQQHIEVDSLSEFYYNYTQTSLNKQSYTHSFNMQLPKQKTEYQVDVKYSTINNYSDTLSYTFYLQIETLENDYRLWRADIDVENAIITLTAPDQGLLCKADELISYYVPIKEVEMQEKVKDVSYGFQYSQTYDYMLVPDDQISFDATQKIWTIEKAYHLQGILTNIVFEHMYLSDNQKQLKISFNPKVSSFKQVVLENKIETIGGQYPIVFRNGNISYAEFPIGGLISYQSDETNYFLSLNSQQNESHRDGTPDASSTIINNYNQIKYNELCFKQEVLKWLNNGQPKLFRSSTEGNHIVRLINISLSPEDKLGRMLHSFTSTAIEIDTYSLANLQKYNLLFLSQE